MKNSIVVMAVCGAFAAMVAEGAIQPKVSTPEEKAARAERRLRALNETGGFIGDPRGAQGKYVFFDCGTGVEDSVLNTGAKKCQNSCMILTEIVKDKITPFSFKAADERFKKSNANMATFLIDEDGWPLEVVCPEKRWVAVNIRALKIDNPAKEVFEARVRKMMTRSVGQVFQAGYAFSSISTMNLIANPSDLDKIATEGLATECTTVVIATAEKFGFRPMKRVLYRKAVQEGWAPPPVNSFQKSAWDSVHKLPEKPLKIEFDPAKGK